MNKTILGCVSHPTNEFHNLSELERDISRGHIYLVTNSEPMTYGFYDCIAVSPSEESTIGPDHYAEEVEQVTSIDQINPVLADGHRTAYCYYDGSRESCYYTMTIVTWDNREEMAEEYDIPEIPHSWDKVISQEEVILDHLAKAPHFFWHEGSPFALGPGPMPRGLRYEVSVLQKLREEGKVAWQPPVQPLPGNDRSKISMFLAKGE